MKAGLRQEKEKLVLELYSQGKTHHEIAKEARISLRDIRPILSKGGIEQSLSLSSQAYKLFSEGKTPLQVAIALNLKEPEVNKFYTEYLKLDHLSNLHLIYEQIKDNIGYFVSLSKSALAAGFNERRVIRLLSIANNDLPAVEYRYQQLKRQEASLKAANENAAKSLKKLNDDMTDGYKVLDQNRLFCKQQKQEINKILLTKTGLEEYVEWFQKNNDVYLKIKETIKSEIKFVLTNPGQLLKIALDSLIESSRADSRKFYALCYNKNITSTTSAGQAPSTKSYNGQYDYAPSMNKQSLHPDYNDSNKSAENILLEESKKLYNKIIDDITSKTISKGVLLPQPEICSSHTERECFQKLSAFMLSKEEHTFIQSEISDKGQI